MRTGRGTPRKIGIERKNDRRLLITCLTLAILGGCYGYASSSNTMGAIFFTLLYGLAGLTVGVPIGFAINVIRP